MLTAFSAEVTPNRKATKNNREFQQEFVQPKQCVMEGFMGRIRQLDMATANGIAAGEVVERPSSVVKELVENAMDAGATVITVEIEGGGISLIRVTDDGCGMDEEDAKLAFSVHATSKIETLADLFNLHTMGFRGEALSSIGAAAKVTLRTKQPGDEKGTEVVVEGGKTIRTASVGTQSGTSIAVRDLFYNLPARYKFLKKDNTEVQYVLTLCQRFALIRPDISFRVLNQGKEVLHTPGNNDPESTLYCIYGKKIVDSCIYVDEKYGDIQLRGFIGKPEIAKGNRNEQIFFVNERLIRAKAITSAIDEAYKTMLMKGRYAFCILSLYIPSNLVDVNVHPQKSEVRFWSDSEVFKGVYHTVQNTLLSKSYVKEYESVLSTEEPVREVATPISPIPAKEEKARVIGEQQEILSFKEEPVIYPSAPVEKTPPFEPKVKKEVPSQEIPVDIGKQLGFDFSVQELLEARVLGIAFATYIVLELKNNLLLLDQHAAHEKILFEKLLEKRNESTSKGIPVQNLLTAEMIEMSASDFHYIVDEKDKIELLGFAFDVMGDREVALRAVPALMIEMNPVQAFILAVNAFQEELPKTDEQVLLLLATTACKAAVKGHDKLHDEEIKALLEDLVKLSNPYHCPHGRPIMIRLSKRDLEKEFKRIV